ncbi:hypothetical protein LINGRAHAP2_LOCUS13853 [Linum grandiflorum]
MTSALVAQFLGPVPPFRVFSSMAARLWGSEGPIVISLPSIALCEWVLQRSWHIHHLDIQPLDLSKMAAPQWITLKGVPPLLITLEGIGWIASQVGEPTGKFVRDGLDVKVCVVVDSAETKTEIPVKLGSLGEAVIEVEYPQARVYKAAAKVPLKRWVVKQPAPAPPARVPDREPVDVLPEVVVVPRVEPLSADPIDTDVATDVVSVGVDVDLDEVVGEKVIVEALGDPLVGQTTPLPCRVISTASGKATFGDYLNQASDRGRGRGSRRGRVKGKRCR